MVKAKTTRTKGKNDSKGWTYDRAKDEVGKDAAAVSSFGKMNSGLMIRR